MKNVIIIGAGIAGLAAGLELSRNNIDFQILESSLRVGGSIETLKINDLLIETGPHTFNSQSESIFQLVKYLGIEEYLLEADPAVRKKYICQNGKLFQVPSGLREFFKTKIISKEGKMTLLEELFIKKYDKEESVEDFIERRFGREILKNLVQPYLNGLFAGDIQKLSVNAVFPKIKELELKYKSVLLGMVFSKDFRNLLKKQTFYSFSEGMEILSKAIYEQIKNKITLGVQDIDITRAKDFFVVNFKANNRTINHTAGSILFAVPAYKMDEFLYLIPKEYREHFTSIDYVPLAVVNQLTERSKIKTNLDGFGFLCTKEPHRKLLGTIWSSSIFPNRAPKDKILLTSCVGGALNRKAADQSEEEIQNQVSKELVEILQIPATDNLETIHTKVHKHAIPQYNIGHMDKIKAIENLMESRTGLFFTGNYLRGRSVNDTVKYTFFVVEKIKNFLSDVVKKQEKDLVTNT